MSELSLKKTIKGYTNLLWVIWYTMETDFKKKEHKATEIEN